MFFTPEERDHSILPHDPVKAIIAPRPIGWISTVSKEGVANLAPYSFFNAVSGMPPMLMFSSEGAKDTATNAIDTGEFVHNYVSKSVEDEMNLTSIAAPAGVSEFEYFEIEAADSNLVKPQRVAKAFAALECKVTDVVQIKDIHGTKTGAITVIGQVVGIHVSEEAIKNGRFDVNITNPVTRLGYLDFALSHELHEMPRPQWNEK